MGKITHTHTAQIIIVILTSVYLLTSARYWDYYEKVLEGPRPLLSPNGILLADNVLFHGLVPLAEALAAGTVSEPENVPKNVPGSDEEVGGETRPPRGVEKGDSPVSPRRLNIGKSLDGFNKRVAEDDRVEVLMLPLRDGLSVVRWKDGCYPALSQ